MSTIAPPYAKVLVSRNGGTPASGGIVCAFSDAIQLSAQNTAGWGSALWEIADYPPGFSLPAGWTLNAATGAYFFQPSNPTTSPPSFALPASGSQNWGKFALRLRLNGNPFPRNADGSPNPAFASSLTDEATILSLLSPLSGLQGLAFNETTQFDPKRSWASAIMAAFRALG